MTDSRALSQHEIDALLNQIPADDAAPAEADGIPREEFHRGLAGAERGFSRTIKTYDFRRPDKFSKEQWQAVQGMHEQFARTVGAMFSQRLRTLVAVRLSSIDQGLYEEWQSQVPSQTVCCIFSLPPLSGNLVVEFNMDVAAEVVDRLLGGTAVLLDRTRELGDIELQLVRSFAGAVIGSVLEQMWRDIVPAQAILQDVQRDPGHVQVAGPNDVAITSFFEVNLGNHLGAMSICTPFTVVEPITPKLSAQSWRSDARIRHDERTRAVLERLLRDAPLEVAARLGEARINAAQVASLRVGDTLVLDTRIGEALSIAVGEHIRFAGRPGLVGNRVGLTVTRVLDRPPAELDLEAGPALLPGVPNAAASAGDAPGTGEAHNVTPLRPTGAAAGTGAAAPAPGTAPAPATALGAAAVPDPAAGRQAS